MSESLIGRKVRLTGAGWRSTPHTPARGTIHTIIEPRVARLEPGAVYFEHGGTVCYVFLDPEGSMEAWHHDWAGELLPEVAPELRPYAIGFLDGLLGLEMQDADDDYERGYQRGVETGGRL